MNLLDAYIHRTHALLEQTSLAPLESFLEILERARAERRRIFIFGNGGSSSTASHFAADLAKNTRRAHLPPFQITCLNDNTALLTAYGNDEGYDSVFVEPLRAQAHAGDIVIAISASGNSPNVVRAVECANDMRLTTIGLTGFSGGKLKQLTQHCIIIPSNAYEHIEDLHLVVCHALVAAIKEKSPALNDK